MRRFFELKNHLTLRVEGEEQLGYCEICSCRLNLKVFVPRQIIMDHTTDSEYAKFPPNQDHPKFTCWLKQEAYDTLTPKTP